ncbi:MAG: hypothetical protein ACC682_12320 [Gemmatimonadota bacterium]
MTRSRVRAAPVQPAMAAEPGGRPESEAAPGVTVIVLVTERPIALDEIYREYSPAVLEHDPTAEFLFAVQPWARKLTEPLKQLIDRGEPIRIVESIGGLGEANLLREAAADSSSDIIVTMPCYRRVEASALPALIDAVADGAAFAVARRWPRADGWMSRLQTWAFNRILQSLVGHTVSDIGSGVQAMRRRVLEDTPLYGDFFRFLPVLAMREGFTIVEVDAAQHPDDRRTRIYSPGTYVRRLIDVLGLFFLVRFTEKPLRFFGLLGGTLSLGGGAMLLVLLVQRLAYDQPLADRPILLVAIIALTMGIQAIALGLIGEMIVNLHASRDRRYRLMPPEEDDA